jgi:hypothetical protein
MENQVPQSIAPQLIHGASLSRATVVIFMNGEFDADHQTTSCNEHCKAVNCEKLPFRGEHDDTDILP